MVLSVYSQGDKSCTKKFSRISASAIEISLLEGVGLRRPSSISKWFTNKPGSYGSNLCMEVAWTQTYLRETYDLHLSSFDCRIRPSLSNSYDVLPSTKWCIREIPSTIFLSLCYLSKQSRCAQRNFTLIPPSFLSIIISFWLFSIQMRPQMLVREWWSCYLLASGANMRLKIQIHC